MTSRSMTRWWGTKSSSATTLRLPVPHIPRTYQSSMTSASARGITKLCATVRPSTSTSAPMIAHFECTMPLDERQRPFMM